MVNEVFSDPPFYAPFLGWTIFKHLLFERSFREMLPAQVSQLVNKIKEGSTGGIEGATRRQVQDRVASLSQSQLNRVADVLAMIWDGMLGLLDIPPPPPNSTSLAKSIQFPPSGRRRSGAPPPPNWDRMKLALFKSISTRTFVEVKLNAYNAIHNTLPLDPKPLFTSSIVVKELTPSITERTRGPRPPPSQPILIVNTETARIDLEAPHLLDELTDDYEPWQMNDQKRCAKTNHTCMHPGGTLR